MEILATIPARGVAHMKLHALHSPWLISVTLFFCLTANVASATSITGTTAASSIQGIDVEDNDSIVSTIPITYLATAPQTMRNTLSLDFLTWNFFYEVTPKGLAGKLNISTYRPISRFDDNGGAEIDATFTREETDPMIANLHWIQLVITNLPADGGSTFGYIDPLPNDDTLPFYWTVPEDSASSPVSGPCGDFTEGSKTASTYHFYDCSMRTPPSGTVPTHWTGDLLLASWQPNSQNVTIYDGIQWGWTLTDPVPEPDSLVLFFTGFLGFGFWRFLSSRKTTMGPAQPPHAT